MSRIGKQPIPVPRGVKIDVQGRRVRVEGPKGQLEHTFPTGVEIQLDNGVVHVTRQGDEKRLRAFHGMTRALIANMVAGVAKPFEKVLEIHGTGYSANPQGQKLELDIGFSNKVQVEVPSGLDVKADKGRPVVLTISGADKAAVGQLAANIRALRPPSPYGDNKGIRYRGEVIRKKAGKAFGDKK